MVDDVCFNHDLRYVTNFTPPESTTDCGIYKLKYEVFHKPINITVLTKVFDSSILLQIMFYAVYNILVYTEVSICF